MSGVECWRREGGRASLTCSTALYLQQLCLQKCHRCYICWHTKLITRSSGFINYTLLLLLLLLSLYEKSARCLLFFWLNKKCYKLICYNVIGQTDEWHSYTHTQEAYVQQVTGQHVVQTFTKKKSVCLCILFGTAVPNITCSINASQRLVNFLLNHNLKKILLTKNKLSENMSF